MRFRRKPVVIEAEQFTEYAHPWPEGVCCCGHGVFDRGQIEPHIHTLEGVMRVSKGDWIITGVKGERYPCKPGIFAASYERVEDEAAALRKGERGGEDR